MSKFKAGDLVYCPQMGYGIFTLHENRRKNTRLPFIIYYNNKFPEFITADGKFLAYHKAAIIFHATPENQKKLEHLHGIKLEDAPTKPTGEAITELPK